MKRKRKVKIEFDFYIGDNVLVYDNKENEYRKGTIEEIIITCFHIKYVVDCRYKKITALEDYVYKDMKELIKHSNLNLEYLNNCIKDRNIEGEQKNGK